MTAALSSARHRQHDSDHDDDGAGRMSFLEHLEDLRKRIIHSCIALGVGMAVAFPFMKDLASFVLAPTLHILPPGVDMVAGRPTEMFAVSLDIALMAGLVLAAPVIMYQVWLFIVPALYANEKKFVIPFVALTAVGTLSGAAFSHWVLFPGMMSFFVTFTLAGVRFEPRIEYVFELYVRSLIGMVIVFQIPTLAFFLAKIRVITARFLWRNIKYSILIIFIVAAVLTPSSDPWNMAVFAAPMLVLYMIGIGVAWLGQPKRRSAHSELRLVFTAAMLDQARRQHVRYRSRTTF
jgi:sec-independent protein translocase protein TatC